MTLEDRIIDLYPMNASTGAGAYATPEAVQGLRSGAKSAAVLVAVSQTEARIFKPATAKGAHKSWDHALCDSAKVAQVEGRGYCLVAVFNSNVARAYSLPGLKEIAEIQLGSVFDPARLSETIVTPTGDIFGWTGPSQFAIVNVFGTGQPLAKSNDTLWNPQLHPVARPTISNLQWISGTQYCSPADLDLLVGGPDRPMSKRMIEQMRAEEQASRSMPGSTASSSRAGTAQEGWGDYMTRQLNERTENLNIMGDSMDKLEESSAGFSNDVNKFVSTQKKKAMLGGGFSAPFLYLVLVDTDFVIAITGKWF
jgi:syntaxin-binding protein 5